jgi:predicted nucleotidyltransferase
MKDKKTDIEIIITCNFDKKELTNDEIRDKLSDSLNMYLDFVEQQEILPDIKEFNVAIRIDD